MVTKDHVLIYSQPTNRQPKMISTITKTVAVLKVVAGMEPDLLDAVLDIGYDGLVLEVLGQGNVSAYLLSHCLDSSRRSRSSSSAAASTGLSKTFYGYDGGGKQLKRDGHHFSNGLNSQKARLRLLVELESGSSRPVMKHSFSFAQ